MKDHLRTSQRASRARASTNTERVVTVTIEPLVSEPKHESQLRYFKSTGAQTYSGAGECQ